MFGVYKIINKCYYVCTKYKEEREEIRLCLQRDGENRNQRKQ